jgi:hypothetical protein
LGIDESPLPRSPGYSVKCRVNRLAGNPADYTPGYPVRNPESYLDDYPACYWAGNLPENPVGYSVGSSDSNSADYSADCPDNRPERNPESNLLGSGAHNPPDDPESDSADTSPDSLENLDPLSVCRAPAQIPPGLLSSPRRSGFTAAAGSLECRDEQRDAVSWAVTPSDGRLASESRGLSGKERCFDFAQHDPGCQIPRFAALSWNDNR